MKKIIYLLFSLVFVSSVFAQQGKVRGVIIDDENAETLIGVSVVVEGTTIGTITDLDGNYSLSLDPGSYTIVYSYISYASQRVTDVIVKAGETKIIDLRFKSDAEQIGEVVVTAERITNNETALQTIQKKSANVLDGVSAQTFTKTGDNDAAAAMRRVTGVSVEGGKYVYVRGLGDRYTKTQLNGVDIPGLDPDRNTVQMDIFPSNLLDNIVVYKTFTPDLPADFTGGMVNINTKSFPSSETFSFSTSLGYTIGMNFNSNALRHKGGAGTFMGFGNKYRELPFDKNTVVLNLKYTDPAKLTSLTSAFSKQLAPTVFTSPLNGSFSISKGNQIDAKRVTLGYNTAFNYRYQFRNYDEYEFGRSIKGNPSESELLQLQYAKGQRSEQEIQWSGMLGGALKTKKSKYIANILHSQNAQTRSADYSIVFPDGQNTALPLKQFVLDYSQRSVSNLLLAGTHNLKEDKWELEWKLSPTYSKITEPDIRSTKYLIENGEYIIDNGDGAVPERFYRYLTEINTVGKVDVTHDFKVWKNLNSKLKFGVANTFKTRDYAVLRYLFNSTLDTELSGNGDELLLPENIYSNTNTRGTYVSSEQKNYEESENVYQATQNIFALYAMNELPITPTFKAVYGVRFERTDSWISGYGRLEGENVNRAIDAEKVFTKNDILPAANFIYNFKENMNFRLSYSKTLARPSFKEKSFVSILDPLSGVRFIGNIQLEKTDIHNVDLRWEGFFKRSQMLSISAFYKNFQNPIEIAGFELAPNDLTPRNAGSANLYGAELEFRVDFGFISPKLTGLSFSSNFTYVKSQIDMRKIVVGAGNDGVFGTDDDKTEYETRQQNLRDGETLSNFRPMFGQSPFIVNANLGYVNDSIGFEANLTYNVQGKRLAVVGIGIRPDVYEQSFHSLNFKVSQKFGSNKRWKASFTAQNLVGDLREKLFESYNATPQVFERYNPNRSFTVGFSYLIK
ncbi:MAG: TonB-dependent receptor [Chitinophagales bacterium]|nr:TonB-dependent receptor [Chitinophagales bacterium]